MDTPRASEHYPSSLGEFRAWFGTDADCLNYLEWLRWPTGFRCPANAAGMAGRRIEQELARSRVLREKVTTIDNELRQTQDGQR